MPQKQRIKISLFAWTFLWATTQTVWRFLRHHGNLTPTTACWLISRSIIIHHLYLRTCLPRTGCTPDFLARLLRCDLFNIFLNSFGSHMQKCIGVPVTAPQMANVSELLDMAEPFRRLSMCPERIQKISPFIRSHTQTPFERVLIQNFFYFFQCSFNAFSDRLVTNP